MGGGWKMSQTVISGWCGLKRVGGKVVLINGGVWK